MRTCQIDNCDAPHGCSECEIQAEFESEQRIENERAHVGWPGDGSGMDDFADYNANEANDYSNE